MWYLGEFMKKCFINYSPGSQIIHFATQSKSIIYLAICGSDHIILSIDQRKSTNSRENPCLVSLSRFLYVYVQKKLYASCVYCDIYKLDKSVKLLVWLIIILTCLPALHYMAICDLLKQTYWSLKGDKPASLWDM